MDDADTLYSPPPYVKTSLTMGIFNIRGVGGLNIPGRCLIPFVVCWHESLALLHFIL